MSTPNEVARALRAHRTRGGGALDLARGESDSLIARTLCVSPHTVRHHVERVFQKLQVRSRNAIGLSLTKLN